MSITSGFFNSMNGDRKYNAEQMSAIFDGIINDGIFASIGTAFNVTADSGNNVVVGKGRAWFNSTWIYNDAPLQLTLDDAGLLANRYDAIVIEIDHSDAVRAGSIKVIRGESSSSTPEYPTLTNEGNVHQYPLAYIYREANDSEITQADITNKVGSSDAPFVTGILEVISLEKLLGKWESELDQFVDGETEDFNEWFEHIKDQLDEDAAGNLQNQIDETNAELEEVRAEAKTVSTTISTLEFNAWAEANGITDVMKAVTYGNGKFVAVGYHASKVVGQYAADTAATYYSEDGITWTAGEEIGDEAGNQMYSVCYGDDMFVAGCYDGRIYYSKDGISWTQAKVSNSTATINAIAYGNYTYVAMGDSRAAFYSDDGINWSDGYVYESSTSMSFSDVIHDGEKFIAINQNGTYTTGKQLYISGNGYMWMNVNSVGSYNSSYDETKLAAMVIGDGTLVASDTDGTIYYSLDGGLHWVKTFECEYAITKLVHDGEIFVGTNYKGDIYRSTDGVEWTRAYYTGDNYHVVNDLTYAHDKFVMVGENLAAYTSRVKQEGNIDDVLYGMNTRINANETSIRKIESQIEDIDQYQKKTVTMPLDELADWTSGLEYLLEDVTYGQGKFVAVGYGGATYYSEDGIEWTKGSGATGSTLNSVVYSPHKDMFVAVGDGDKTIFYSYDGIQWSAAAVNIVYEYDVSWMGVAYGDGQFYAAGSGNYVARSKDGVNWEREMWGGNSTDFKSIAYNGYRFLAAGSNGMLYTSYDGGETNSSGRPEAIVPSQLDTLVSVACAKGTCVVVTENGAVYTAIDGSGNANLETGDFRHTLDIDTLYLTASKTKVKFVGDRYFIITPAGALHTSLDGLEWDTILEKGEEENFKSFAYNDGFFVGVGSEVYYTRYAEVAELEDLVVGNVANTHNILIDLSDGVTVTDTNGSTITLSGFLTDMMACLAVSGFVEEQTFAETWHLVKVMDDEAFGKFFKQFNIPVTVPYGESYTAGTYRQGLVSVTIGKGCVSKFTWTNKSDGSVETSYDCNTHGSNNAYELTNIETCNGISVWFQNLPPSGTGDWPICINTSSCQLY